MIHELIMLIWVILDTPEFNVFINDIQADVFRKAQAILPDIDFRGSTTELLENKSEASQDQ